VMEEVKSPTVLRGMEESFNFHWVKREGYFDYIVHIILLINDKLFNQLLFYNMSRQEKYTRYCPMNYDPMSALPPFWDMSRFIRTHCT
jgi:hypothetical protein